MHWYLLLCKMAEVKSKDETIEELIASRERIEIEYQEYKNASKSVGELIKRCEENAGLVAELECARKVFLPVLLSLLQL